MTDEESKQYVVTARLEELFKVAVIIATKDIETETWTCPGCYRFINCTCARAPIESHRHYENCWVSLFIKRTELCEIVSESSGTD